MSALGGNPDGICFAASLSGFDPMAEQIEVPDVSICPPEPRHVSDGALPRHRRAASHQEMSR